jgi:microcystin-dependent protein
MATATIPNSFTNGTNADANLVNANFSYLSSWLNTNVIQPNAANFSVFPTLPSSAPTSDYQAVHKSYVDLFMPAGVITQYVGTAAPAGWRLCDGTQYNAADSTYARLWAAIGTTYGGSGINAFSVPDLRGRVPVGYGAGAGLTARSLNDKAGAETHTLDVNQMPNHNHDMDPHSHTGATDEYATSTNMRVVGVVGTTTLYNTMAGYDSGSFIDYVGARFPQHSHTFTTGNADPVVQAYGGGQAHNNMQPFIVVSYIIKL